MAARPCVWRGSNAGRSHLQDRSHSIGATPTPIPRLTHAWAVYQALLTRLDRAAIRAAVENHGLVSRDDATLFELVTTFRVIDAITAAGWTTQPLRLWQGALKLELNVVTRTSSCNYQHTPRGLSKGSHYAAVQRAHNLTGSPLRPRPRAPPPLRAETSSGSSSRPKAANAGLSDPHEPPCWTSLLIAGLTTRPSHTPANMGSESRLALNSRPTTTARSPSRPPTICERTGAVPGVRKEESAHLRAGLEHRLRNARPALLLRVSPTPAASTDRRPGASWPGTRATTGASSCEATARPPARPTRSRASSSSGASGSRSHGSSTRTATRGPSTRAGSRIPSGSRSTRLDGFRIPIRSSSATSSTTPAASRIG